MEDPKFNHRTARLKELSDAQLKSMSEQFSQWRYKTQEQLEMVEDLNKELTRRAKSYKG